MFVVEFKKARSSTLINAWFKIGPHCPKQNKKRQNKTTKRKIILKKSHSTRSIIIIFRLTTFIIRK